MNALLTMLLLLSPVACRSGQDAKAEAPQVRQKAVEGGYSQIVVTNDEGNLMLFVRGSEITAIHDGAVVPADRIVRTDDRIRVLSEDGGTLFDVRVADEGFAVGAKGALRSIGAVAPKSSSWLDGMDVVRTGTRKVIGVTTTPVDAALAAQLGIDPEQSFVINDVTDGMPAEKAGVKSWDVVVRIDGEPPGTVAHLREALGDKEEGQTVRLSILRRGEPVELDVGFKQTETPAVSVWPSGGGPAEVWETSPDTRVVTRGVLDAALARRQAEQREMELELDAARERLETRVVELRDAEAAASLGKDGVGEARLKELRAEVEHAKAELAAVSERLHAGRAGAGFLDLGDDGGRALFVPPTYADPFGALRSADDGARDVKALQERIERLEAQMQERMARLEELMQKLVESGKQP